MMRSGWRNLRIIARLDNLRIGMGYKDFDDEKNYPCTFFSDV